MTTTQRRIVGAGICCLDHIVVAPSVRWGDAADVRDYCAQGGGLAATAVVACARLGAETTLLSMLGDDPTGDEILAGLAVEQVATYGVQRKAGGSSPFSFIHVDVKTGERTIFHRRAKGLTWRTSDASAEIISRARAVIVDDYFPDLTREVTEMARAHGVPVVADTCPKDRDREWLARVDVLIAPRHYVRGGGFGGGVSDESLEAALEAIHGFGPATAVITLGADGWVASSPEGRCRGVAFPVNVVDTVGAGDVFHGGYAFGITCGWSVGKCAEFASAVAALKCTRVGGRSGIPGLRETLAFLRAHRAGAWSGATIEELCDNY